MSSLRNIKKHIQCVRQNDGILATDQVQIVTRAAVPTDANLANGRLVYVTGTGLRAYIESAWVTLGAGGASSATWNSLYDSSKTLTVDESTMTVAGATALAAGDVLTITAAAAVTGDCLQFTNSGTGSDVKGTSGTWSVSKAGAAVFASVTATSLTSGTNLALNGTGAGTIAIGDVSTGAVTITPALTAVASVTITGSADTDVLTITDGDMLMSNGILQITTDDTTTGVIIGTSTATTGHSVRITADACTEGSILYLDNGGASLTTGYYINCNDDGTSDFTVGADGATVITTATNSTVALLVTGVQTNEDMVRFSANGVTATGQSVLQVTQAGASAAGSAVLLVNHTGTPAASTSYLAVFDYETATEATNDPITVEIRGGVSVGACLNIISKATTITGGILNITNAEMTSGVGINMQGLAALDTGQAINIAHATSVIADTGSLIRATSSGVNTGGATNGTVLDLKTTGQLAGTMCRIDSIQTTGTVLSIISSGIMTTTGNLLTLTANSATTASGLLRVNCNAITSGDGVVIASSSTAITTGALLKVTHSGNATATALAPIAIFSSAAADNTTIVQILDASDLAAGIGLDISLAATTTGTGIDMGNFSAVTSGKGIFIDNDVSTLTSGYLIHLDSASTAMTTGRLLLVDHTGNATATAMCSVAEIKSAAAENTVILSVTGSAALAGGVGLDISVAAMTTGTALDIGGMAAITTGNGIVVAASGTTRTDGMLLSLTCASTAATSTGRMLLVNHTGATGVSTILAEVKTAATDETIALQLLASGALALGKVVNIVADSCTTGFGIDMTMDALTTGVAINIHSDSADVTARDLVHIHNDNVAAVGAVPLTIVNDAVTGTGSKFKKAATFCGFSIWVSIDNTSPNGALTGTTGDLCMNATAGKLFYATNGAGQVWQEVGT